MKRIIQEDIFDTNMDILEMTEKEFKRAQYLAFTAGTIFGCSCTVVVLYFIGTYLV